MKQHKYKATLTSDQGKHTINLLCSSIERAKEMIMEAASCPESDILEIVEITDGKPLTIDREEETIIDKLIDWVENEMIFANSYHKYNDAFEKGCATGYERALNKMLKVLKQEKEIDQ